MANDKKIKTHIEIQNIAPIEHLTKDIVSNSLKFAVFADNGSGKTFISRLFRLTEEHPKLEDNGRSSTDILLRFGHNSGLFSFKISDDENTKEDISININKKEVPSIPNGHYLYHVFNQDYVEENIKALGYEKDSDIQGYILGKAQIDLSDDENKLKIIEKEGVELKTKVEDDIKNYIQKHADPIRDIRRLKEYGELLNPEAIFESIDKPKQLVPKSFDELLLDYNKIKSVPDTLSDIPSIAKPQIEKNMLDLLEKDLEHVYSLSSFAEDFKEEIKNRQSFIEEGLNLYNTDKTKCPFCKQEIKNDDTISLIDKYTQFLHNSESKTIKLFQDYIKRLKSIKKELDDVDNINNIRINNFNEYKTKYIPACENIELNKIDLSPLKKNIDDIIPIIDKKIGGINIPLKISDEIRSSSIALTDTISKIIDENNKKIETINYKKNSISEENKNIRREICKSVYNYLIDTFKNDINHILELRSEYKKLNDEIIKKKEKEKVSKKVKVAETIKTVLNYFFSGKYTLDEDNFRIIFDKRPLIEGQVKDVLSDGEKNIVAFAYYIGDTHLIVDNEDDYKRLFFIIDDPISSMDFTYVYTLCGVIRDIKSIIDKLGRERFMVLTHNNDFMRILASNRIVDTKLLLKDSELKEFNENFTVPYICHLIDIYKIARCGAKANHTTANSIRHIIETLTKFQNIEISSDSIEKYIRDNIPNDKKSYTYIQDLSHGGWRSEQEPMTDDDYKEVCETVISHIERKFEKQIEYCKKICN